ncbi:MAG: tetratricopeptide repeat protein [Acidobacteriota bacterium]
MTNTSRVSCTAVVWNSHDRSALLSLLGPAMLALWTAAWAFAAEDAGSSLASADAAMQAGRFADAAREYEGWIKDRPESREVLLALGVCYVQLGRPNEAVGTLRRYLKLVPDSASGHAALGIALLDGAQTAEAKEELETALRLSPAQVDAAEALARLYLVEGKAEKVVPLLRSLAETEARDETRALLGEALIRAGQAAEAAAIFERALAAKKSQSTSQDYALAAWAWLRSGDAAKAAELCEEGMRIFPDSEIEGVYLSLPAPFLAERIGTRIERLQEAPTAAEAIAVGRVLIDADAAQKTRANEIAQQILAHAVQLAPGSASAHYNYGRALRQGGMTGALEEWEKALTLQPEAELRLRILMEIGAAKLQLADFEGTEQAFRAALEINRKLPRRNPQAALEYVRFLQLRSRPAEAEELLRQVMAWNPLSPEAHAERGKLLAGQGEWEKVIEEGGFVLRNAGENRELMRTAHLLLALAYHRLRQPDKAQPHESWLKSN